MSLSVAIKNELPKLDLEFSSRSGRLAIFGPSGAGKTTALKIIAGLQTADMACVEMNGAIWQADSVTIPPHLRGAGFVFQDDRLFPHMSVAANLEYGQTDQDEAGLKRLIEMTGIGGLLERSVHTLSGGEHKRIAIARALAASPSLLLLDEPYAGLDRKSANQLRRALFNLLQETNVPHILVSHQLDDVLTHAREVLLLEDGKATGFGTPEEVFATEAGQRLIGLSDDMLGGGPTTVLRVSRSTTHAPEGLIRWDLGNGDFLLLAGQKGAHSHDQGAQSTNVTYVRIRGTDVSLATTRPEATSVLNVMEAEVSQLTSSGNFVDVALDLGRGEASLERTGLLLSARITSYSATHLGLAPGQRVFAMIKSAAITR